MILTRKSNHKNKKMKISAFNKKTKHLYEKKLSFIKNQLVLAPK